MNTQKRTLIPDIVPFKPLNKKHKPNITNDQLVPDVTDVSSISSDTKILHSTLSNTSNLSLSFNSMHESALLSATQLDAFVPLFASTPKKCRF